MSLLSNWRSGGDGGGVGGETVCRPAGAGEMANAMRWVLSTGGERASDSQVVDFLRYALVRGVNTNATWVAERGGEMVGALLPVPSEGGTMLMLGPAQFADAVHREAAGVLIETVVREYRGRGVRLAQVLLDPSEGEGIDLYLGHGFERLAELVYLEGGTKKAKGAVLGEGQRFVTYGAETHALFAATIAATYEGSLDCPALSGRRDIEDIVAGHRATGAFEPGLWFMLMEGEAALGVVLLSPATPTDLMELVYLGLVSGARGRGLGDVMMRQALRATQGAGLGTLTMAVDATNRPALALYFRHGMRRTHSKVALMRDLGREDRSQKSEDRSAPASGV